MPSRLIGQTTAPSHAQRGSVHIVHADEAIGAALALVVGAAGYAVRRYTSSRAFLEAAPQNPTGCILIDIGTPRMDGLEFQRQQKALGIDLPVIVVTSQFRVSQAVLAFKAGAFDFIERLDDTRPLLDAVAAAFERCERDSGHRAAVEWVQQRLRTLTQREREVLDGLLAGRANKEIARALDVSSRTIEVYRARLMLKMDATSVPGLVRMALIGAGEL